MNGILSVSGQSWVLDAMLIKIVAAGGLYVGLMTNSVPLNREDQTPSGILELSDTTCSGYSRQLCSNWTHISGVDPYLIGSGVTFTVASGDWKDVYGYFVSSTNTNSGVLWTELIPHSYGSIIPSGNPIIISPIYRQY